MNFIIHHRDTLKIVFPDLTKNKVSGIYFIFSEKESLIYVGKAKSLYERLYAHFFGAYDNISSYRNYLHYFSFIELKDYSKSDLIEKDFIRKYEPKLNIKDNKNQTFRYDVQEEIRQQYFEEYAKSKGFNSWREYQNTLFDKWEGL